MNALDMLTVTFYLFGFFFFLSGTAGLIRFPDVFSRMHALTKADNVGLGMIILGTLFQRVSPLLALKLLFLWVFVILSSSACSFLIANHMIIKSKFRDINIREDKNDAT